MRVVAAPDKLRGTATALEVAAAVQKVAESADWECTVRPMADGGDGTLDVLGGPNQETTVTGPLGVPVNAAWRLDGSTAVIEMARASGLALVGGAEHNDPVAATSRGTGELIVSALDAGARRVLVGVGGSATTDGGLGAVEVLEGRQRLDDPDAAEVIVLCDVRTYFVDAPEVFAPQKGASPAQIEYLRARLDRLAERYFEHYSFDVRALEGAGAAGGLAGGLAAVGSRLVGGFDAIAQETGLRDAIDGADLVITAEGFLDRSSFDGKVVGGVAEMSESRGVPCLAIVGELMPEVDGRVEAVSLVDRFGRARSTHDTISCIENVVSDALRMLSRSRASL